MQTINLDWLQYSGVLKTQFNQKTTITKGGFFVEKQETGTVAYKNRFYIYSSDGEAVATLLTDCNMPTLDRNMANLQIANNLLYTNILKEIIEDICLNIHFEPKNITRIDIALDGANRVPELLNKYKKQKGGHEKIILMGRHKMSEYEWNRDTLESERFTIGSSKGDKYISVYCKSNELKESKKNYITEYWKQNGMDTTAKQYRVEARIMSKYINTIKDFYLDDIHDQQFLKDLFYTATRKALDFRENKFIDKTKCPRIEAIDWNTISTNKLDREYLKPTSDIFKIKLFTHLVHKHSNMGLQSKEDIEILEKAKNILVPYAQLEDWEKHKAVDWAMQYVDIKELFSKQHI